MIKLEQVTEILKSSRGKKMEFQFLNMNKKFAEEICYNWKYEGIFSFYNMTEDKEDLQGFLDTKNWNRYSAVLQENSLVGFFMFQIIDDAVFIGLGLKPDLTGKGYGKDFVLSGIDYLKNSPYGANKKIPFWKKFSRGGELILGHWTWATASILIFVLGWLPIFFAGNSYQESILFYTVPKMASRIMTFAMFGMVLSVWYSWLLLPSRPDKVGKVRYLGFLLAWLLIPIEMIFFNSFPVMEAQTRCMLGKYMGFWCTPKIRK